MERKGWSSGGAGVTSHYLQIQKRSKDIHGCGSMGHQCLQALQARARAQPDPVECNPCTDPWQDRSIVDLDRTEWHHHILDYRSDHILAGSSDRTLPGCIDHTLAALQCSHIAVDPGIDPDRNLDKLQLVAAAVPMAAEGIVVPDTAVQAAVGTAAAVAVAARVAAGTVGRKSSYDPSWA